MYNYEITIALTFNDEENARLICIAMSPDMNLKSKGMESNLHYEGRKVYLTIRSDSLSRLRGMVNSFFRTFRMISDII